MRLNTLHATRGVAALLVVLYHSTLIVLAYFHSVRLSGAFRFGSAGVDFFFVVSGFIIFTVHERELGRPSAIASFVRKRLVRIYPPYWVVLAGMVAVYFLVPTFSDASHRQPSVILKSVLLWPQLSNENVLAVAWTLSYELLFYAVFALALFSRRIGLSVFFGWQLLVLGAFLLGRSGGFFLDLHNLEFGLGVFVAIAPKRWPIPSILLGALAFFGFGLCQAFAVLLMSPHAYLLAYGFSSAIVIYGLAGFERSTWNAPAFVLLLGDASYAVYLVHYPALSAFSKLLVRVPSLNPSVAFVALALLAVASGIAFHVLVERRLLAWFGRPRVASVSASQG